MSLILLNNCILRTDNNNVLVFMAVHLAIFQYNGIVNTGGCAGNLIDLRTRGTKRYRLWSIEFCAIA